MISALARFGLVLALLACDTTSSNNDCSSDCNCVCESGQCVCNALTMPECAPSANTGSSCSSMDVTWCMGCSGGAGYQCSCRDGGFPGDDGGEPQWLCIGTGNACTGTTR